MCGPFSPPGPVLAGPEQAPGAWIGITVALTILIAVAAIYGPRLRQFIPRVERDRIVWLYLIGILVFLLGVVLMGVLALPWMSAVQEWKFATLLHIAGLCSTQPLDAIAARTQTIATIVFLGGLVCFVLGSVLQVIAGRRYRRVQSRA